MKPKTAFALLVVLVAAVLFVLVRNTGLFKPKPGDSNTLVSKALFPNASYDITAVTVTGADGTRLAFVRGAGDWQMTEPVAAKAATSKVWALISAAKDAQYDAAYEANAIDPAITRLQQPLWTVELADAAGSYVLKIGAPAPLRRNQTYVRPAGDTKTYVVSEDFAQLLSRPANEYRDMTLVSVPPPQVVRIRASGQELAQAFDIEKHGDAWGIVRPYTAPADRTAVQDILEKCSSVVAKDIAADDAANLGAYGLAAGKERLVVQLSTEDKPAPAAATSPATTEPATTSAPAIKITTIAFGEKNKGRVYARVNDRKTVYQLDAKLMDDLLKQIDELRDKRVVDFDAKAVAGIDLAMPDGKAKLTFLSGQWKIVEPQEGPANSQSVRTLLETLTTLKAQSWADEKNLPAAVTGLSSPTGQITLRVTGKSDTVTLLIGSTTGQGETYVKTAAGTAVAKVNNTAVQPLLASPATYWDANLFALGAGVKVTQLVVNRRDESFSLVPGSDNRWQLAKPKALPADQESITRILNHLTRVQATKVIAVAADVAEKYSKAVHNLTLEVYTATPWDASATQPASQPTTDAAAASTTQPAAVAATTQPTSMPASAPAGSKVLTLQVVKVDGKSYAWIVGQKVTAVGEFAPTFYDDMAAELRDRMLWTFNPEDVKSFRVVAGSDKIEMRREGNDWTCLTATDEKVETLKVRDYLSELRNMRVERYVMDPYNPEDAEKLGLKDAWLTLELRMGDGKTQTLTISRRGQEKSANRYAIGGDSSSLLTLTADTASRVAKTITDFKAGAPAGGDEGSGAMPPITPGD